MKQRIITLVLLTGLMPTIGMAQENVKKAFDKFVTSKKVEVKKTFSEERDFTKENRPLVSKADIYAFTIKKSQRKLIDEVLAAFEKDRDNKYIYSVLTHTGGHGVPTNTRELLVGNRRENSVYIGQDEMQSWQLSCLLDPADATRSHRYAYVIEWSDDPKQVYLSGKIRGRLVVTYSPIPQNVVDEYLGNAPDKAKRSASSEDIANEINKIAMTGKLNLLNNKAQMLTSFEALKTEFMKENTANSQRGSTIVMSIYVLCEAMAPMMKDDKDLRKQLVEEINTMCMECNPDIELGRSQMNYLTLAKKALR